MEKLLIFLLITALLACEEKDKFKNWESDSFKSASDQSDFKGRLAPLTDEAKVTPIAWGNVAIFRSEQKHNSIDVDGSSLKWLVNDSKNVFFANLHYIDSSEQTFRSTENSIEEFKRLNPPDKIPLLKSESLISYEYKWVFLFGTPKLYLVTFVEDRNKQVRTKLYRYGVLARQQIVGSAFESSQVRIFPNGPKWSALTDIEIPLLKHEPLSTDHLRVVSDSARPVEKIEPWMKFDISDERFDQVQVYYYLQKSLEFQKNVLGFESPAKLKARVHVGFPDSTNPAFYFNNEIRLGQGDDVFYSQLSRDPSIVYHESMHFLIDQVAGLPFQGEGGSINEGFADFYTAVALKKPTMGESSYLKGPYKRNIAIPVKFSDRNGGLYHDSAIVSSMLWQIKELLGESIALEISREVLLRLSGNSDFAAFNRQLQKSACSKKDWEKIEELLTKMDFPLITL